MGQRRNIAIPSQQFAEDNKAMVLGASSTQKDLISGNYIYLANDSYLFWLTAAGDPYAYIIMDASDVLNISNYETSGEIILSITTATDTHIGIQLREDPVTAEDLQVVFPVETRLTAPKIIIDHDGTYAYTYVPLSAPLTSATWAVAAGNKTSANNGTIDLSSVFSVPAGVKAVDVRVSVSSSTPGDRLRLGPSSGQTDHLVCRCQANGIYNDNSGTVNCDSSGDIYATITGTITCLIEIWGYYI